MYKKPLRSENPPFVGLVTSGVEKRSSLRLVGGEGKKRFYGRSKLQSMSLSVTIQTQGGFTLVCLLGEPPITL